MSPWRELAAALADELVRLDKLRSPEWIAAVRAVPRHELVPVHYRYDEATGSWTRYPTSDDLPLVYSNTALFVLPGGRSSTSMPGLMTRMLESLDLDDDQDVLEIGTGTGYNAGLLAHRLGDQHVTSVDIETDLVELARRRLARLGYAPTLVAADGVTGHAAGAPYHRIIVTCSVHAVPWAWIEQLRPAGLLLVDLKLGPLAGNLVLLRRDDDRAEGRFDPTYASFMPMRHAAVPGTPATSRPGSGPVYERTTDLDLPHPWEHGIVWFLAHHAFPAGTRFSLCPDDDGSQVPRHTVLAAPDGSWCQVDADPVATGVRRVREAGTHRLWSLVEGAHRRWVQLGRPGWERFGYTATHDKQWTWLDDPANPLQNVSGAAGAAQ
jgi:protein-L-isoaspartate(D-aspartate) O-methyltransferase